MKGILKGYYTLLLILLFSCSHSLKDDIIKFDETSGKKLMQFIDTLNTIKDLDTDYRMQYLVKSQNISFHYLDTNNVIGDEFHPKIQIKQNLKDFFFDIGLHVIFSSKKCDCFDIHLSHFQRGRKDVNMMVFKGTDTVSNSLLIHKILGDGDEIVFKDKNVYYYQSNWY